MNETKRVAVTLAKAKILLANASNHAMDNSELRDPNSYSRFMEAMRDKLIIVDDQIERDVPDHRRKNRAEEIER